LIQRKFAGRDDRPWLAVDLNGREHRILIDSESNSRLELKKLGRLEWLADPVNDPVVAGVSTLRDKYVQRHAGARSAFQPGDLSIAGVNEANTQNAKPEGVRGGCPDSVRDSVRPVTD